MRGWSGSYYYTQPSRSAAPAMQPWRASRPATTQPPPRLVPVQPVTVLPGPGPDCVTQAQFDALVKVVAELEITVGILVEASGPIPENNGPPPPLPDPPVIDLAPELVPVR